MKILLENPKETNKKREERDSFFILLRELDYEEFGEAWMMDPISEFKCFPSHPNL